MAKRCLVEAAQTVLSREEASGTVSSSTLEVTLPLSGISLCPYPGEPCTGATPSGAGAALGRTGAIPGDFGADRCGSGAASDGTGAARDSSCGTEWLSGYHERALACSPFMALGGAGDDFDSLADILVAAKQALCPHPSAVPLMKV